MLALAALYERRVYLSDGPFGCAPATAGRQGQAPTAATKSDGMLILHWRAAEFSRR